MNNPQDRYHIETGGIDSLEALQAAVDDGARFVLFSWTLSVLAFTFRRLSPAILIGDPAMQAKYKSRYNRLNYILGWWGVPWGPVWTIQSIRSNNNGGVDVTTDIMQNISPESFTEGAVYIEKMVTLFKEPEREDRKAFDRALKHKRAANLNIGKLVAGLFINTDAPFYILGIATSDSFSRQSELLKEVLHTEFYKNIYFEFIDIGNDTSELSLRLQEQGVELNIPS